MAGYEDLNDAARLAADPTFRLIGSPKIWDRGTALTSTLHWFETELLTREENLVGLMAVNREVLAQAESPDRADRIVLDMDSSESPVHGQQEGSAYNGHFESVCYHPLSPDPTPVRSDAPPDLGPADPNGLNARRRSQGTSGEERAQA